MIDPRARRWLPWLALATVLIAAWLLLPRGDAAWHYLGAHRTAWLGAVAARPAVWALVYVAAYAGVVACSLPAGGLLTVTGGLLFGTALGGALAVTAASLGAILLFLIARSAFGTGLARRAQPLVERLRPGLERDGFSWLLALRLIPVVPFWLTNLAPALLGMRLKPYVLATVLGIAPATVVLAGVGAGVGDVLAQGRVPEISILLSAPVLLPLLGLAALSLLPVAWRFWRAKNA